MLNFYDSLLNSALADKADSSTVSSLSTTLSSETPRIYRLTTNNSDGYISANYCFPIASLGSWPAIIFCLNRVGIMNVVGNSATSTLSPDPVSITWLNGGEPSGVLSSVTVATHTGATNGLRIKLTFVDATTDISSGIMPLRNHECYNYYLATS